MLDIIADELGARFFKAGTFQGLHDDVGLECPRIVSTDLNGLTCKIHRGAKIRAVFRDECFWVVGVRLAHAAGRLEDAMAETRYQLEGNAPQLYERETVHTLGRPWAELMFARVSLHAGDRVLDAACGTGIVTRVAVQRYGDLGHVVGVDLNAGMLEVARAHTPATRVPIEWRQGDVCALPFPDRRFDVVLYQQGLQFVPDPGAALRDIRRVLVPGGRLAFTVFNEIPPYYAAMADALARHVSADAATSCLSRYTLREATTVRQLVEDAGFGAIEMRVLEVMRRMPASPASVVEGMARAPYARDVAAVEEAVRQAIGREVSAALQAYRDGDEVVIPHRSHLVQAQVA
jgi:ubiquinone/menaquinone biosynthesis C-methylase UbiE